MAKIISFINLKGGVGKTTSTINVAASLVSFGNKVLVIDLDPQTNATISLITQEQWKICSDTNNTLYELFNDKLNNTRLFNIQTAIQKDVGGLLGLDLLPSSMHLVDIQDQLMNISNISYQSPVDILKMTLQPYLNNYDYILIDCPPNLGTLTLNGILISNYFFIPTIPDHLSKIGISIIFNKINGFKQNRPDCIIGLGGIFFTKVDNRTNLHFSTKLEMRSNPEYGSYVLNTEIPSKIAISEAFQDNCPFLTSTTAQRKSTYSEIKHNFETLAHEILSKI